MNPTPWQISNSLRTMGYYEYSFSPALRSKPHLGVSRCSSSSSYSQGFSRELCIIESPLHLSSHSASVGKSITIDLHLQLWVHFPSASNMHTLRQHHSRSSCLPHPLPSPISFIFLSSSGTQMFSPCRSSTRLFSQSLCVYAPGTNAATLPGGRE